MPEKFIWRTTVAVHCLPRIVLFSSVIHKYYKNTQLGWRYSLTTWWFGPLNFLNCISQVVENGALMVVGYISSTDHLGKIFTRNVTCEIVLLFTIFCFGCFSCP